MTAPATGAAPPRPVTPQGILAAMLVEVRDRLDGVPGVDASLRRQVHAACDLAGGLEPYVERLTSPESPALAALAARTRTADWAGHGGEVALEQEMLSGHVEGRLLRYLVRATRARRVLEIGMFTGYSALAMAEALPADGVVVACELDPGVAELARASFAGSPAGSRIDVRVGPATEALQASSAAGESFDLVFIDADKGGYLAYVDAVLEGGLLAPGGTICVDNTLLQGQPWLPGEPTANGAAIAAFNEAVAADTRVEQVVVPLRDGLTLLQRVP